MQTSSSQSLFADADQLLAAAHEEFSRAEEDAVTHLICHNSRQSISNYLMGYLLDKGAHIPYPVTLNGLLQKCQALNPSFQEIDLAPITCRFEADDKGYCLDHTTVDECFRIAQQTQALVKS